MIKWPFSICLFILRMLLKLVSCVGLFQLFLLPTFVMHVRPVEDFWQQLPQLISKSQSLKWASFTHTLQIAELKAKAVLDSRFYEYFSQILHVCSEVVQRLSWGEHFKRTHREEFSKYLYRFGSHCWLFYELVELSCLYLI